MTTTATPPARSEYEETLLALLPEQGRWSEEAYLWLTDHTNRLIEFTDGVIEALPMPTDKHQSIIEFVFMALSAFLHPLGGKVHIAGIRLRIRERKYREPDIIALRDAKDPRRENRYWTGADLTLEVVSPDKPARDLIDKRFDYAEGGVPEYWIVNPLDETITVLKLADGAYVEHGVFRRGDTATSALLPDFTVTVGAVFDVD